MHQDNSTPEMIVAGWRSILHEKSLSGSFALYAFLTKPALFNGYIAASKQCVVVCIQKRKMNLWVTNRWLIFET